MERAEAIRATQPQRRSATERTAARQLSPPSRDNRREEGSRRERADRRSSRLSAQRAFSESILGSARMVAQRQRFGSVFGENRTGLPDPLKSGIESLSGIRLDHVKVHYNSAQPGRLDALAYAQGSEIHVAPGQERHLPHEAWHIVQQAQGRVQPTQHMKDGVQINDDRTLEHEADVMGAKAATPAVQFGDRPQELQGPRASTRGVVQGVKIEELPDDHQPAVGEEVRRPDRIEEPDDEQGPAANDQQALAANDAQARESEIAREETAWRYHAFAAAIFSAAVLWRTYRARTGHPPGGRAARGLNLLFAQMDTTLHELHQAALRAEQAREIYRNPFRQGFLAGIDPWPMPIAERYAPWREVLDAFYRFSFLAFAGERELLEYQDRVRRFALRGQAPEDAEEPSSAASSPAEVSSSAAEPWPEAASSRVVHEGMRVRSDVGIGFGAGAIVSSLILSRAPVLASPVLWVQVPWDAFHVVNALALAAERARRIEDIRLRQVLRYQMRAMVVRGRQQMPWAKLASFVRTIFKK